MEKIELSHLNETIYYECLPNGLEVYLLPNKNVNNFYISFCSKYGSIYNDFKKSTDKKYYHIPSGVAHFLEHTTFYMEDGDASDIFSSLGSYSNAYTSFKVTNYNVFSYNKFKENLNLLLDFVQKPYYTEKNIKDEKGIICEEVKMYKDMPDSIALFGLLKNMFHTDNIKNMVTGEVSDVKSTKLEDILASYNTFYHPSNMFIVITGNFNPDEALAIISENQINKKFEKPFKIEVKKKKEKASVVKEKEVVKCNVEIDKVSIGIKVPLEELNDIKLREEEISVYVSMILNASFGRSSELREKLVSGNIITNGIFYDSFKTEDYLIINIISETPYPERYISIIKEKINDLSDIDNELTRKSRVAISSLIFALDNIETMNEMIVDNIVEYGHVVPNYYDIYKSLDLRKIKKVRKIITKSPMSVLTLTKK